MKHLVGLSALAICFILVIATKVTLAQNAKALFYDPGTGATLPAVQIDPGRQPTGTPSTSSSALPVAMNPGVRYWIELVYPGEAEMLRVNADRAFRSGERIRIHFTANYDGYLFIMQRGSTGQTSLLFPTQFGVKQNFLKAGQDFVAPVQGWFRFDQTPGYEHLQVVFFPGQGDPAMLQNLTHPTLTKIVLQDQLLRIISQYSGSKDLIVEIDNSYFNANPSMVGAPTTVPDPELGETPMGTTPPATYAVNAAQGPYAPPVVFDIRLRHE
jgi:hypothetical protein